MFNRISERARIYAATHAPRSTVTTAGTSHSGKTRVYMGVEYARKPTILTLLTGGIRDYRVQARLFKEQRLAKHRDRLLEELSRKDPDVAVVRRTMDKLKAMSAHSVLRAPRHDPRGHSRDWSNQVDTIMDNIRCLCADQSLRAHHDSLRSLKRDLKEAESAIGTRARDHDEARDAFMSMETNDLPKGKAISTNGAVGAILLSKDLEDSASHPTGAAAGPRIEAAITLEDKDSLTKEVSGLLHYVTTHASTALPFDFPFARSIDKQVVLQEFIPAYTGDSRTDNRIDTFKKELERMDVEPILQSGVAGKDMNDVAKTDPDRIVGDRTLVKKIGMSSVLMPILGLTDHLSIGQMLCNTANVKVTDDGKLGVVDLVRVRHKADDEPGRSATRLGHPPRAIVDGCRQLVADLKRVATSTPSSPDAMFNTWRRMRSMEGLVSSGDESFVFVDELPAGKKNAFAANMISGLLDGIEYFERNAEVFMEANKSLGEEHGWKSPEEAVASMLKAFTGLTKAERDAIRARVGSNTGDAKS